MNETNLIDDINQPNWNPGVINSSLDSKMSVKIVGHEPMRIAGKKVDTEGRIDVHYPYTNEVIGTVPRGTAAHAKEAFEIIFTSVYVLGSLIIHL
mgnify:CR=1 FL=1